MITTILQNASMPLPEAGEFYRAGKLSPGGRYPRLNCPQTRGTITLMQIHELNHEALHVADVDKSSTFYRDELRLKLIPRPAFTFPGAWFRLGTQQELHLIGERVERVAAGNRGNHFALRVDELDSWEAYLQKAGADFRPRKQRPDSAWQVFLRDPDGHVIELFIPPKPGA